MIVPSGSVLVVPVILRWMWIVRGLDIIGHLVPVVDVSARVSRQRGGWLHYRETVDVEPGVREVESSGGIWM